MLSWSSATSLRRLSRAFSSSRLASSIVMLGDREPSGREAERGGVGGGGVEERGRADVGVVRAAAAGRERVPEGGLDGPADRLRGFGLDVISRSDGGGGCCDRYSRWTMRSMVFGLETRRARLAAD